MTILLLCCKLRCDCVVVSECAAIDVAQSWRMRVKQHGCRVGRSAPSSAKAKRKGREGCFSSGALVPEHRVCGRRGVKRAGNLPGARHRDPGVAALTTLNCHRQLARGIEAPVCERGRNDVTY